MVDRTGPGGIVVGQQTKYTVFYSDSQKIWSTSSRSSVGSVFIDLTEVVHHIHKIDILKINENQNNFDHKKFLKMLDIAIEVLQFF